MHSVFSKTIVLMILACVVQGARIKRKNAQDVNIQKGGWRKPCMGMGFHDSPPDTYSFDNTGQNLCKCKNKQCGPYMCAGDSHGVRHQAPAGCAFYQAGPTAVVQGKTYHKTFGHWLTPGVNSGCGQCYLVRKPGNSSAPGALVFAIDGWGGVKKGSSSCSPEMGNAECHKVFGKSCFTRQDFEYTVVPCP